MNLAKFLPPKPISVLERERLAGRLLAWEDKKLVLIHAQAGQGKSTLAAGYVRSLKTPAVWYNLDREDDNPSVFLSCLGQAVQRACPDRVPQLPPVPQNRYGIGDLRRSFGEWIGRVFENLPKTSLIVFDDYSGAPSSAVLLHLLKTLINDTPPQVRFMLISRVRPELEIAKLRAAQSVGELTGDDLRFTDAEVQDLFGIVFRMQISQNEAALINGTAEGWPAGLVLMHEYLSGLPPQARTPALADRRAAGFRTHVFDYLAQEVFAQLPPALQQFLLRTSITDYLSAPLMELLSGLRRRAPSGKPSIADLMRELQSRNLFVTALNDDASMVRYHALFREFLRKKLVAQSRPKEVKRLYTVAAAYFRRTGDPVRSIDLLLASGQFEQAVRQIETCGEGLIAAGQTRTLLRWAETLPLEYGSRPWLLFYRAVASRFTDPRSALAFYDLALKGFRSETAAHHRTAGLMLSLCGIIEACFYSGGNFKRMARAAGMATSLLKQGKRESAGTQARLLLALGTANFFIGKLRQSSEALREALALFRTVKDPYHQIQSAIYLAPSSSYLGEFRQAREAVQKGFEALAAMPHETGAAAALWMARAMTALFEGRFTEAQECIDTCHTLARENDLEAFDFLSLDIGGWLRTATGDYEGAEVLLRQCKNKAEALQNAFFHASAAHLLAVNYLHQNRLDKALAEAQCALTVRAESGSRLFYAVSLATIGAVNLKLGRLAKAERELAAALRIFQQSDAAQQRANVLLLLAKLRWSKKREHEAKRLLQEGFEIGKERGFTYYYLFTHAEAAELARTALAAGVCADYCADLLSGRTGGGAERRLRVRCLGGFQVCRGRTLVRDAEWKSTRAKTLIKFLVAQDGGRLSRDAVLETLWPDAQPDARSKALNSMLHRVRSVLEPEGVLDEHGSFILQKDGMLTLNPAAVWTDVGQFLAHLEAAGRMKKRSKPEEVMDEYEKAITLYQGDFLPEEIYSDWSAPLRDRLRARYVSALEDAAGTAEAAGDRRRALVFYEKTFFSDPSNEKACRWLMTRYLSEGRRGEAVRAYELNERALSRDLDLEPEEETKKLYRSIIGG